ncbi:hypothetical protein [Acidovorax sp. SD340]|nr:hypothetical protein [Acidovorax sp. SD340]KQB61351.1 hypothetical protein AE621_00260 [Acidovorax sp. SD340]
MFLLSEFGKNVFVIVALSTLAYSQDFCSSLVIELASSDPDGLLEHAASKQARPQRDSFVFMVIGWDKK